MNYHLLMNTALSGKKQQRERENFSSRASLMQKASWQIARDKSTEFLTRKMSKLSFKQEFLPKIASSRTFGSRRISSFLPAIHQSYRIPRMPTEKESLQVSISYESSCSFCDQACIDNILHCRICTKAYHMQCLIQRGYLKDQPINKSRATKYEWNCPLCTDLTPLLTQDELDHLIDSFDRIDQDRDGYITLDEFLSLKPNQSHRNSLALFTQYNIDSSKKIFVVMDSAQKGVVPWSDFVLFYTCKLLATKDKSELATKLTKKELVTARKLFLGDPRKSFDNEYNIIVTREHFDDIYNEQILSLTKKYGTRFLDVVLADYCYYYDNNPEKNKYLKWTEFVRDLSLLFLLNRSNDDVIFNPVRRASIPPHLLKVSIASRSRFPSIIDNDLLNRSTLTTSFVEESVMSFDDIFRKHAKVLRKLNQRYHAEEQRMKESGSDIYYSIVESLDEEETQIHLPKLKLNRRDDRRTVTDPWTSVRELEQLRNRPILVQNFE